MNYYSDAKTIAQLLEGKALKRKVAIVTGTLETDEYTDTYVIITDGYPNDIDLNYPVVFIFTYYDTTKDAVISKYIPSLSSYINPVDKSLVVKVSSDELTDYALNYMSYVPKED